MGTTGFPPPRYALGHASGMLLGSAMSKVSYGAKEKERW